jgi:hypothetical protein
MNFAEARAVRATARRLTRPAAPRLWNLPRFGADSSLEEDRFELAVPPCQSALELSGRLGPISMHGHEAVRGSRTPHDRRCGSSEPRRLRGGMLQLRSDRWRVLALNACTGAVEDCVGNQRRQGQRVFCLLR